MTMQLLERFLPYLKLVQPNLAVVVTAAASARVNLEAGDEHALGAERAPHLGLVQRRGVEVEAGRHV